MLEATVADLLQDVRYWYGTFFLQYSFLPLHINA